MTDVWLPVPLPDEADNTAWLRVFFEGGTKEQVAAASKDRPPEWVTLLWAGRQARNDGGLPPLRNVRVLVDGRYRMEGVRDPHPSPYVKYVVRHCVRLRWPNQGLTIEGVNDGQVDGFYADTDGPGDPENKDGAYGGDASNVNSGRVFFGVSTEGTTFRNLDLCGQRAKGRTVWDLSGQHAIETGSLLGGAVDTLIDECRIRHVHGDANRAGGGKRGPGTEPQATENTTIRNCTIEDIGRQCFTPAWVKHYTATKNTATDIHRSFVDVEPMGDRAGSSHVEVSYNTTRRISQAFFTAGGTDVPLDHVEILGNHLYENIIYIKGQGTRGPNYLNRDWAIVGNVSHKVCTEYGDRIWIVGATDLTVQWNRQQYDPSRMDPKRVARGDATFVALQWCDPDGFDVRRNGFGAGNGVIREWRIRDV